MFHSFHPTEDQSPDSVQFSFLPCLNCGRLNPKPLNLHTLTNQTNRNDSYSTNGLLWFVPYDILCILSHKADPTSFYLFIFFLFNGVCFTSTTSITKHRHRGIGTADTHGRYEVTLTSGGAKSPVIECEMWLTNQLKGEFWVRCRGSWVCTKYTSAVLNGIGQLKISVHTNKHKCNIFSLQSESFKPGMASCAAVLIMDLGGTSVDNWHIHILH